ncbi:PRC-barrel domain-containing protein [Friedmanniella luteola]|uniref:PRC-barrel domain-containing protein n=1 Tax=Friedmanniella luteola TaxID=546871 RepID=A0A1H1WZM2_9ACTN|nr:PRC-barrel domain-containing protein [Friedmanniella luteola]SDT02402.1 PRC-barrel domain-containing protein [Friedmanniella luteola]
MFDVDDIREWRGQSVVDQEGSKIGSLEGVYFDTSTDEAVFATVKVGLVGGGRLVFVPLIGARVAPKHIRVMTDKKLAKDAPSIDTDGELESAAEPGIYSYYGLAYERGAGGERRLGRR